MPTVQLLLFAAARDLAQRAACELELPASVTGDQLRRLIFEEHFPQLAPIAATSMLAVDQRYCKDPAATIRIREGAEVAVIPPVSGG